MNGLMNGLGPIPLGLAALAGAAGSGGSGGSAGSGGSGESGEVGALTVDGGVTIEVDTQTVRALGQHVHDMSSAIRAAEAAVVKAVALAYPQLLGSAVVAPTSAGLVGATMTRLGMPAGALEHASWNLVLECRRVASAYDDVEGRAVGLLRADPLYRGLAGGFADQFRQRTASVGPARTLPFRPAPTGIADLADWLRGREGTEPGGPGRVDVVERAVHEPGRPPRTVYTVVLTGTTSWAFVPVWEAAVDDPRNLSANLRLVSGRTTPEVAALPEAMERAGVPDGAQVTFVGHSQGGMTALVAAGDAAIRSRFRPTHVVTFGSPVARIPVPKDVHVLSVERRSDLVPSLDAAPNQAGPRHVTVQAGPDRPGVDGFDDHGMDRYLTSARQIDRSPHPSLRAFENDLRAAGVLAAPGETGRVTVRRVELTLGQAPAPRGPDTRWSCRSGEPQCPE